MFFCIAGNTQRLTAITILNSVFTANNATNRLSTVPGGIFDVGECAGAHISSCRCAGILNSTFEDNIGIGLCLRDISGTCEPQNESPPELPPLFERDTIAGEQNVGMINDFVGNDVSISIAADVRYSTFRNNTAASLVRLGDEPVQPQDPLAGGAGLDILDVPCSVLVGLDFENNMGRQGSGIHLDSCTATVIWNNTLVGNTATHEGGAIATVNSHGKGVLLGASKLTDSLALSGGALYGDSGATIIVTNGTQLVNNTVATNGGAVSCDGCQALTLQLGCSATANVAGEQGGACYCDGCTLFQLDKVQLVNNRYDSPSHAVCCRLEVITYVQCPVSYGRTVLFVCLPWCHV